MTQYFEAIQEACWNFCIISDENFVEIILVNDSPWEKINIPDVKLPLQCDIKVYMNEKNLGIHGSRVSGLQCATGDYIILLDQDDMISQDCFTSQIKAIGNAKMVLGNGLFEFPNRNEKIFANHFSMWFATKKKPYIMIRDFIVSPGQCMLKRDCIPLYWKHNIMCQNGADDYFLWLLMFEQGIRPVINDNLIFTHKYTGKNLSIEKEKMYESSKELIGLLNQNDQFSSRVLRQLKRTVDYKHNIKISNKEFIKQSFFNFDIFLYNVMYRLVWRGCLIKNGDY